MEALVNTVHSSNTHRTFIDFIHQKGIASIELLTMGSTFLNKSRRMHFLLV